MGCTTLFRGKFEITPAMAPDHVRYIQRFADTRHHKYNQTTVAKRDPDWEKHCYEGQFGEEGAYYTFPDEESIQLTIRELMDYNIASRVCPSLWCNWSVTDDGKYLMWDGGEKFYRYTEWLEFLLEHFLAPWGYVLNGGVEFCDEHDKMGSITIEKNNVSVQDTEVHIEPAFFVGNNDTMYPETWDAFALYNRNLARPSGHKAEMVNFEEVHIDDQ